jgi:hypothetical protein
MLAAAGAMAWLAQLAPHTAYAAGVLGPTILAGIGVGLVIAPVINTGTFGVAPQDAGVASATVTVGQQLGASVGTSLLNTIFAAAVTAYLTAHLAAARLIGRPALTGLALAHGYDTAFWWTAGIFAVGAVAAGALLRSGPLRPAGTPPPAHADATTAQAKADLAFRHDQRAAPALAAAAGEVDGVAATAQLPGALDDHRAEPPPGQPPRQRRAGHAGPGNEDVFVPHEPDYTNVLNNCIVRMCKILAKLFAWDIGRTCSRALWPACGKRGTPARPPATSWRRPGPTWARSATTTAPSRHC